MKLPKERSPGEAMRIDLTPPELQGEKDKYVVEESTSWERPTPDARLHIDTSWYMTEGDA